MEQLIKRQIQLDNVHKKVKSNAKFLLCNFYVASIVTSLSSIRHWIIKSKQPRRRQMLRTYDRPNSNLKCSRMTWVGIGPVAKLTLYFTH